jgi:hypothetical protein
MNSKHIIGSIVIAALSFSCGKKEETHDHHHSATQPDAVQASGNQELYNEVMKIHDEVMPRMDDIRRLKNEIKEKLEKNQNLAKDERIKLDAMFAKLDSAGDGMMIWMREFRPLPDSVGEEKAREYLENEMQRVKRVRDDIQNALKEAEAIGK